MSNERRHDIEQRERLDDLIQAAAADRELIHGLARRLFWGAVVGGLVVVVALALGGYALNRSSSAAAKAKMTAEDQVALRFDALVQSCEARNAQNVGIVGFLASVDQQRRPPQEIARDKRVAPFFPVHGFPLRDGRTSPETHRYCLRYARSLA